MFKNWFSIGVLTLLTVLSKGDACSCMCGMSEQQLYPVTIMSYNVDTPEKDWDDWNLWRKNSVVDVMTEFNLEDFYGLQETKNGGSPEVCNQIRDAINSRASVQAAKKQYDYISIQNLKNNPNQDCENSIFFDTSTWKCLSFDGLFVYKDWDPRYAFYGIFQKIKNPQQIVVVFNTHAPAGNYPGSHNGFLPGDFINIATFIEDTRKKVSSDHPELVPVIFSGDWNGSVQGQKDFQAIGLETCRIKAGKQGDVGPTWPSTNPSEAYDQILAGQQGMDWSESSITVKGRGMDAVEKASDHLPIEAELYFLPIP
ncbi:MAG: hypothetical protein KFB93_02580 [Simkaniaceae bacterium]|nr:MAG: hypothetical protein KFB93_02580 [Simkaniaceae bacterium]